MAANPRSAPKFRPPVPRRAPTTGLSMIHPAQASSLVSDPNAVMLRPLQQARSASGGAPTCMGGQSIEHVSYVPETSESKLDLGQIEVPQEEKLIDPALESDEKKPENIHSMFDVTDRDIKGFTPANKSPEDEDDDQPPELVPRSQKARNYKKCIIAICVLSVISCLWPITGLCLCIANFTSNKTTKRNDEKDYDSAHGCRKVTKAFIILALIFLVISPIIIIAASVGTEDSN